jgi:hypothetical protein
MKTNTIINIILAGLTCMSLAQDPKFSVTMAKLSKTDGSVKKNGQPDAELRIKTLDVNLPLPDLTIPAYTTVGTRIADARASQNRMEVAIQLDEFRIDYYDYILEQGKWIQQSKKLICHLNGAFALALAQVDILGGGVVEVRCHDRGSYERSKSGWEQELIRKDYRGKDKLLVERYELKGGECVLVGKPARGLRPQAVESPIPQGKQNNKGEDGEAEPDRKAPR